MRLYADLGARRAGQLAGDLSFLLWALLWTWLGLVVHDAVMGLAKVGRQVEDGAAGLAGSLGDAGETAAGVPLVGDQLRSPLQESADAAAAIAEAGRGQQEMLSQLGLLLGWTTALLPVVLVALLWVPRRVSFARRASAARRHLDWAGNLELFALRALATQPVRRLARVDDDPVSGWRRGNVEVVRRLAALELRDLGVRHPDGNR